MNREDLERECKELGVKYKTWERDPDGDPAYDAAILNVWLFGSLSTGARPSGATPRVHGRFGDKREAAASVVELAKKLGITTP